MSGRSWIETAAILSTLAGGLVLAGWALTMEYLRPSASSSLPSSPETKREPRPGLAPRSLFLARTLLLLGGGLACHYLFAGRYPRWALLAYIPIWAGIAVLVAETVRLPRPRK